MSRLILFLPLLLLATLVIGCRSSPDGIEDAGTLSTKSSRGDISFELTPKVQADGGLVVEVRASTHSGDLADLDLASLLSLHADGKTYRPNAATGLRGHHSSGTVTFAPEDKPEQFSITLASVRDMGEQRFEWP